jgi:hypothetical protein
MGAYSTKFRTVGPPPPASSDLDETHAVEELERRRLTDDWYLFAYFRTPSENMHYAISRDGLHFDALNSNLPVLQASNSLSLTGTIRDPFILPLQAGGYVLIHTDGWTSYGITIWQSEDLLQWRDERFVPVMKSHSDVVCSWAPKAVYDRDQDEYVVYWSSAFKADPGRKMIFACRTKDWMSFSAPYLFFDPGTSSRSIRALYLTGMSRVLRD